MFNEMSTPTVPYDQDERFAGLDELVSALEAKWQQAKDESAE
jgi:hypothetical protein